MSGKFSSSLRVWEESKPERVCIPLINKGVSGASSVPQSEVELYFAAHSYIFRYASFTEKLVAVCM